MTHVNTLIRRSIGIFSLLCMTFGFTLCSTKAETHPCLLIGPGDIPALAVKLGTTHLNSDVFSKALEGCVRGQRSDEAVTWLMAWVTHVEATGIFSDTGTYRWNPDYALVCDLQWNFMTSDEQNRSRTVLMNMSEAIYNESLAEGMWYFAEEHINNWAISHMTDYYIQRMLYPALMFPLDSRSAASQARAIEILCHWWDRCPGAITGGPGMMIDETLTSPNGYGLWDLDNFSPILIALARNTTFDPYTYAGNLFHNEGIYRTYILSFWEQDSDIHTFYSKAGYVGAGHGEGHAIVYYNNADILQLAAAYNDPVLAWHYYSNPSPCRRGNYDDFLSNWDSIPPPIGWQDWRLFLYWGITEPISPVTAGWPLAKFFEGAGAAVIRKTWNKHDGLVWFRAGYGGSHYQPCQGTVIYHSNDTVVLGNGGTQNYSSDSRMNNVLLVDGVGQISPYPSLPDQRQSYGTMTKIDDNTYSAQLDSAYLTLSSGVSWSRRVHYDYAKDILEINDSVETSDGNDHLLSFNWVTNPFILAENKILLPGGYLMLIRSNSTLTSQEIVAQPGSVEKAFNTLLVSSQGHGLKINWYVGKNENDLEDYINAGGYTSVEKVQPVEFALSQNYPNPFNPSTAISFSVRTSSYISLKIFDILGREIRTLINKVKTAGTHTVQWDGKNSQGRKAGSGVYFYRIKTESGFSQAQKMILLN